MSHYNNQIVWIIGASSGIGKELAFELAFRGAQLVLSARSEKELVAVAERCETPHTPTVLPLDVRDHASFKAAFEGLTKQMKRIDRIIYLAAVYDPMPLDKLEMDKVETLLAVNLTGVFNMIDVVVPYLKAQKNGGQLAICGSVAGYRGLPNGQPYSATKAAVMNITESLRAEMAGSKVDVRLISPGFVKTPLTAKNTFPMPMQIEAPVAARAIADGLKGNAYEIHFPKAFTYGVKLLRILPNFAYFMLMKLVRP